MSLALERVLNSAVGMDQLINTLRNRYRLVVEEYKVSGKRLIQVNRGKTGYFDALQDECSNVIIDEDMIIISRNVERLYNIKDNFCLLNICDEEPVMVEEWLPGRSVTISRFYSTYLISTEADIHGRNPITTGGPRCNDIVMHAINQNKLLNGLDTLFSESLPESTCWCFSIVPKNEFNISKPEDYDLVLLNAINIETNNELTIAQLNNIGKQFRIRVPQRRHAYGMKRVEEVSKILFEQNPSILGTVVTEVAPLHRTHDIQRGIYLIGMNSSWKSELNKTAKLVLKHQSHDLGVRDEPALANMVDILQYGYGELLKEMNSLYNEYSNTRTRRSFASGVKDHPMAAALFALRDSKITSLLQMYSVVKPKHLLQYVEGRDKAAFRGALNDYKETICRKATK